jgi:hypothetical protein
MSGQRAWRRQQYKKQLKGVNMATPIRIAGLQVVRCLAIKLPGFSRAGCLGLLLLLLPIINGTVA